MIDLLLLGTGGMMPLPNRWLSSLLARCRGELTLFDCGEGTQIPWRTTGWGFRQLGAICLSHWHADHVAGLPGILHSLANSGRTEPVEILGPIETTRVVTGLRQIAPDLPFDLTVRELAGGDVAPLPGGMSASVMAGDHRVPTLIYRVDLARSPRFDLGAAEALGVPVGVWSNLQHGEQVEIDGRVFEPSQVLGPPRRGLAFGYMTDTRPVTGAAQFLRDVDVLVSEGTYGDTLLAEKAAAYGHMTFAQAAAIARDARARTLWLTHFSPAMEAPEEFLEIATEVFPETTIGLTGLMTTLAVRDEEPSPEDEING
jgi:ribonuclease Z